jgi:hypothetical protein
MGHILLHVFGVIKMTLKHSCARTLHHSVVYLPLQQDQNLSHQDEKR